MRKLTIQNCYDFADLNGGKCLSIEYGSDIYAPLDWMCSIGHQWSISFEFLKRRIGFCKECAKTEKLNHKLTRTEKKCTGCGEVKGIDGFYNNRNIIDGKAVRCIVCVKEEKDLWLAENKEKDKATKKIYASKPENKQRKQERSQERMANDPNYKLARQLRDRLQKAVKGNQKTGSAVNDLGCSIPELRKHLESQFRHDLNTGEMMDWNNWAFKGWHIDHIIPLASFDLTDREQFLKACHYTNLQALWWWENLEKADKIMNVLEEGIQ